MGSDLVSSLPTFLVEIRCLESASNVRLMAYFRYVFVLNMRGQPLAPCHPAKARILLKRKGAKIVNKCPFTIQLTHASGETHPVMTLGVDSGYKHLGFSVTSWTREYFSGEAEIRDDVVEKIANRRMYRTSRRGRLRFYRPPRFDNRRRADDWLPPSLEARITAHVNMIRLIRKFLPISHIRIETAKFDIQKLKNPHISGEDYILGEQYGHANVREYVLYRDNHTCQHCHGKSGDPILQVHHIETRKTGGNGPNNLITLCKTCHKALHDGKITLNPNRGKSYAPATVMNIMRQNLLKRVKEQNPDVSVDETFGYITKFYRVMYHWPKSHAIDAFFIASNRSARRLYGGFYFFFKQVRRHNRKIFKDSIDKGGKRKRAQSPYIVRGFRLHDKVLYKGQEVFIGGRRKYGAFVLKTIEGNKVAEVSPKKLHLLQRRKGFLIQLRRR